MPVTTGCHHVALTTEDLDRFNDFFRAVFDAEVAWELAEGPMRHALVDLGGGFHLHPFELGDGAGDNPTDAPGAHTGASPFSLGHTNPF